MKTGYSLTRTREREPDVGQKQPSKGRKINEAERDRARRSTQTAHYRYNHSIVLYVTTVLPTNTRSHFAPPHCQAEGEEDHSQAPDHMRFACANITSLVCDVIQGVAMEEITFAVSITVGVYSVIALFILLGCILICYLQR